MCVVVSLILLTPLKRNRREKEQSIVAPSTFIAGTRRVRFTLPKKQQTKKQLMSTVKSADALWFKTVLLFACRDGLLLPFFKLKRGGKEGRTAQQVTALI